MRQIEKAKLIQLVTTMAEQLQQMMDVLLPPEEDDECKHPADAIEHDEAMDDEPSPYLCTRCGKEQDIPFH